MLKESMDISAAAMSEVIQMAATRAGLSADLFKEFMNVTALLRIAQDGNDLEKQEAGRLVVEICGKLGKLEQKARRYDLLVEEEKKAQGFEGK